VDASGNPLASRSLGLAVTEGAHGIAALAGGRVAVTGSVTNRFLGPGAAAPAGFADLFVLAFGPDLACSAVLRSGTEYSDVGMAIAVGADGRLVATGSVNLVDSVVVLIDAIP